MYQISTSVWLDLQDTNYDGLFEWSDNSRLDYTSWAPNEPSSDPHDTFYQVLYNTLTARPHRHLQNIIFVIVSERGPIKSIQI